LSRKKVNVEVKMAEDGTHNPDRLLYHIKNNQPIDKGEPEAEESYDWLNDLSHRQIDDFDDVNEGEKSFFKLWNSHLHEYPCYGDQMLLEIMQNFIDLYAVKIHRTNLYKNFVLHMSNLSNFGAISSPSMMEMINQYQGIIQDMVKNPEKYPLTPEKVPIENPYYVPKPVSIESLKIMQNLSSKKENSVKYINKPPAKKNFWLKKSFRNPIVKKKRPQPRPEIADSSEVPETDVEDDENRWPRKKAMVTFANEIFVEEIKDLDDKTTGNFTNFLHDVTDLYKFISPGGRLRRGCTSM